MPKHPHCDLLIALAMGEPLQYFYREKWCDWTPGTSQWPEFDAYDWRVKPNIDKLLQRIAELELPKKIKVPGREEMNRLYGANSMATRNRDYLMTLECVYSDAIKACGCEVIL